MAAFSKSTLSRDARRHAPEPSSPSASSAGGNWLPRSTARTERPRPRIDSALVKAPARAHRWQRMLETGECGSITELAAAEKIDRSYLCRVLRLTPLSPEIVEAILAGRQPEGISLPELMTPFSVEWEMHHGR